MDGTIHKYVCKVSDLDKVLDKDLTGEFQSLFYDIDSIGNKIPKRESWRMFFRGMTPEKFFARFGVDFDNPTVRIAVALDMIKLDDGSVSNSPEYTFFDNSGLSPSEIQRKILNRNYRVNLVNLEPCYRMVKVGDQECRVKTIEKIYQGLILDDSILMFMSQAIELNESGSLDKLYVPVGNGQSAVVDIALITHSHADFSSNTSRAYYDLRYSEYMERVRKCGLELVSSFALVDQSIGKSHTGSFIVKGMKKIGGEYVDVSFEIDKDGGIVLDSSGKPELTFHRFGNLSRIVSVCEFDFNGEYQMHDTYVNWSSASGVDVLSLPIEKYTTSSRYSVFKQRIPNYELKDIRNYINYKKRLSGMEVCLEQLERSIWLKEVQCSDLFVQRTLALWKFLNEFKKCEDVMELTIHGYELVSEIDRIGKRKSKLELILSERESELNKLLAEYSTIGGSKQFARKMELGEKIRSLKLEINGNIKKQLESLDEQCKDVLSKISDLNKSIYEMCESNKIQFDEEFKSKFNEVMSQKISQNKRKFQKAMADKRKILGLPPRNNSGTIMEVEQTIHEESSNGTSNGESKDNGNDGLIVEFDSTRLNKLNRVVNKLNSRMFNLGWELNTMKKMHEVCQDATIKVRRMLRNFKDRISKTREFVWDDEKMEMRSDIDFSKVQIPNMLDIILLHEWFAVNPDKEDYGMKWEDECQFRVKCRQTAIDLRRGKYSQLLESEKIRIQDTINDIRDKMSQIGYVRFNDENNESDDNTTNKPWTLNDVTKNQLKSILPFNEAMEEVLKKNAKLQEYNVDQSKMNERTIGYLVDSGLISSKKDIEKLATRSIMNRNSTNPDILNMVEDLCKCKSRLDSAILRMTNHKRTIRSILDMLTKCEVEISSIKEKNRALVQNLMSAKKMSRHDRNSIMLEKIENETKIQDMNEALRKSKDFNVEDLSTLQRMRDDVDKIQSEYDGMIEKFKTDIGLSKESVQNMMVQIYNKYQDEILNNEVK